MIFLLELNFRSILQRRHFRRSSYARLMYLRRNCLAPRVKAAGSAAVAASGARVRSTTCSSHAAQPSRLASCSSRALSSSSSLVIGSLGQPHTQLACSCTWLKSTLFAAGRGGGSYQRKDIEHRAGKAARLALAGGK